MGERAAGYPGVDEGTACTQASFKVGGKAFLFTGQQGGRHKVMLKLKESLDEAMELAAEQPETISAGKGGWVTLRFTDEDPPPAKLWRRWLDESYAVMEAAGAKPKKKAAKKKATKRR